MQLSSVILEGNSASSSASLVPAPAARGNVGKDARPIGASNFTGHEAGFTTNWRVNSHLNLLVGYSHFFAGDYLRDTGAHSDADFGYVQAALSF